MSPFEPAPFPMPSPAPASNTVERPKKERKKREAKPKPDRAERVDAKKSPKKKAAKKAAPKAKADTISVSLKEFAGMRAGAHAKLFMKVHKLLAGESKAARKVVLAEIAKVLT